MYAPQFELFELSSLSSKVMNIENVIKENLQEGEQY